MKFSTYYDKVRACWLGKNIGGTLGMPFEGHRGTFDLTYYTHDIQKGAFANDDLDLQLVALTVAERYGKNLTAENLGEYWLTYVPCDWCEYGAGKNNMRRGFLPPVSGALHNVYANSNGAFIRSELWACLCPADPAMAAKYAFEDASIDHSGEGVYGEIFCAAVQSAAFAVSDMRELVRIGLSFLPDDCLLAKTIRLVIECYDNGLTWQQTRKKLLLFAPSPFGLRYVYDNNVPEQNPEPDVPMGEVGNDAATNVAINVIGMLFGEGDFSRSLCITASCGEDTDCTAGFIGALLGILRGTEGIEDRWIYPIGDEIKTITIDTSKGGFPHTVTELCERVTRLCPVFCTERMTYRKDAEPELFIPSPDTFDQKIKLGLFEYADKRLFLSPSPLFVKKSCTLFDAALSFEEVEMGVGETKKMTLTVKNHHDRHLWLRLKWHLPEGVSASTGNVWDLFADQFTGNSSLTKRELSLSMEENAPSGESITLEIAVVGHPSKVYLDLPLIRK